MAIQRHSGLQAQGVAGAQAAGDEAELLACLAQDLPQLGAVLAGGVDLIAQLAGVAGAGDHAVHAGDLDVGQGGVIALGDLVFGQQLLHDGRCLGALEGQLSHGVGDVLGLGAGQHVLGHVGKVLFPVGGVHHGQVRLFAELIHHQVVDGAALLVAHGAVAHLVDGHAVVVVGQQVVQGVQGRGAGEQDLTHVGHIEQTALLADSHVFLDHARAILHRQQIPGEGDDLAALLHVDIVQRGLFFHLSSLLFL